MNIDHAIDDVAAAERDLAQRLLLVAERHAVEHDLFHLGRELAARCADRLRGLQPFAERYGAERTADGDTGTTPGFVENLRRTAAELLGRSDATGLLLLGDLRENYLTAQRAEISWAILLQAAKAIRDTELIATATTGRDGTEVTAKWLRTKIKVAAPQILARG